MANVKKFQKIDSIRDLTDIFNKVNKRVELAKNQLTDLIQEFPKISIRKASSAVRLSFCCVKSFFKDLHLKPYKEHEYNLLKPADNAKRIVFVDKKNGHHFSQI